MHELSSAAVRHVTPQAGAPLSANELRTITSHLATQEDLWRPQVIHDPTRRSRSQLLWSPQIEIWLIGWHAGQGVEPHDHGGASGAFTVCEGVLEMRQGSRVRAHDQLRQRTLRHGDSFVFDSDDVHEVVNRSAAPATTIHAYSPALTTMNFYETVAGQLVVARRETASDPDSTVIATPVGAGRA